MISTAERREGERGTITLEHLTPDRCLLSASRERERERERENHEMKQGKKVKMMKKARVQNDIYSLLVLWAVK